MITDDFKFIFLNELNNKIGNPIDMSVIRLITYASFDDKQDLLILAGINGVFVFKFKYHGDYSPELAAKVDSRGVHITIEL